MAGRGLAEKGACGGGGGADAPVGQSGDARRADAPVAGDAGGSGITPSPRHDRTAPSSGRYARASTCRCRPSPVTSSSTTSPALRYGFGSGWPIATPAGVPVLMTSPGYRVMNRLT
ncbi:hypothetical protein STREPTOSP366_24010 [Streptomyces variabilis]